MSAYPVRLPDVGEGVAEAELVEWLVRVGDHVLAEAPLAEVLTDKANVEIASPVSGVITALVGQPGDRLAVGSDLAVIELDDGAPLPSEPDTVAPPPPHEAGAPQPPSSSAPEPRPSPSAASDPTPVVTRGAKALASPAVRARAAALGIDLSTVSATGSGGIVTHADLDRHLLGGRVPLGPGGSGAAGAMSDATTVEPIRGVRRRIAERLTETWTQVPHITVVEEIDATELEALRTQLNRRVAADGTRLTLLPFIIRALTIACREQPRCNAHYDADAGTLTIFDAVHVGIATQTDNGLLVPVVRDARRRDLHELAQEIARVADAARAGTATREELSGSTITITSLGALGGIATTPIINRPEVAIIGVNKMTVRPVWIDGSVVPRTMFNLSSSFDHRIIDGWDAAVLVRRVKELLEVPSLLFLDG